MTVYDHAVFDELFTDKFIFAARETGRGLTGEDSRLAEHQRGSTNGKNPLALIVEIFRFLTPGPPPGKRIPSKAAVSAPERAKSVAIARPWAPTTSDLPETDANATSIPARCK